MKLKWIFAALALLPTQALSLTMQCNHYRAWHYPDITLEETQSAYVVTYERSRQTFTKTLEKRFGVLVETGVDQSQSPKESHVFIRDAIQGVPVIIVDSMVFSPRCNAWDKDGDPELPTDKLWLLKPKL